MATRIYTMIVVVTFLASALPATAAEDESAALFNGRDLTGWTYHLNKPNVPMEDVWSAKDGKLVCKGQPVGYLLTKKKDLENYVLTLEWRWPEKPGNNGVLVHVTKPGALGVWPKCLEVQLGNGDAGDFWVIGTTIDVPDIDKRKEDRRHLNLTDDSEKPLGEWNQLEITCSGDEVIVKVNGVLVNHATKVSQTKGAIALQSEGAPIEYRNIKLRKLAE
ncbi:MAG: DUF1080 domain-containing protein [Pirellulales bacterium]